MSLVITKVVLMFRASVVFLKLLRIRKSGSRVVIYVVELAYRVHFCIGRLVVGLPRRIIRDGWELLLGLSIRGLILYIL